MAAACDCPSFEENTMVKAASDSSTSHVIKGSWFAIRVRSSKEGFVSRILRNKGYNEFLPVYRARRRWSDRVAVVELPLFPGYVFCRFDVNDHRNPVLTT